MSIADKLTTIAENEQKVYDAGRTFGQGDIWDIVQNFGKRRSMNYAFANCSGVGFKPKYPLRPTTCLYMFNYFANGDDNTVDLREIELDTSGSTDFGYMNNFSKISAFGTIDTTKATSIANIFYNAKHLHTVELLILKDDGSQTAGANVFLHCSKLKNINIQGKWGKSVSVSEATQLSKDSITSFVNALLDTATGQTLTLSLTAVEKAFETSEGKNDGSTSTEWNTLIATKPNWTISLA